MHYDPFRDLRRMMSAMSRFPFEEGFGFVVDGDVFPVDVYETEKEVVVVADMPSVRSEDLDVTVTSDSVTIQAKQEEQEEEKRRNYSRRERRQHHYARTINLPAQVEAGGAEAKFEDGKLELRIPKKKEQEVGEVKVEVK